MILHKEKENLINKDNANNDNPSRRNLCCCFCCIFFVIFVFIVFLITHKHHSTKSRKQSLAVCNSSECLGNTNFPKDLSELQARNRKLCETVTNKGSNSLDHIYIVKDDHNLTDEQACGIESVLRLFPDRTIYLLDFKACEDLSYNKCTVRPNYLGLLTYLYKDRFKFIKADKVEFFKNTPLHNLTKDNFQFMALLLTAYKYGGFVTSPDVIMTSRDIIECFPEETVVESFTILTPNKCDDFLHYLMQSFSLCQSARQVDLDTVLTQSAELYSKSLTPSARRLRPQEICSNVRQPCTFLKVAKEFDKEATTMINGISNFCKQVVQAYLGIKINQLEVAEETSKIKITIKDSSKNKNCENLRNC